MMEERRSSSPLHRRRAACDLSIYGEAIATSRPAQSAGHKRRTGEVDIETVYQTCASLANRTRRSTAGADHRSCRRSGPESHTERSQWDFDPFLKDDTGRMISTKTPVAKMTAPVSMVKVPRVDRTSTGRHSADKSDVNASISKSENNEEVAAAEQADRPDEDNSSNTPKKLTNAGSVVKAPRVDAARNGSFEKIQCDKEVPDKKKAANRFDKNNSSNKCQKLVAGRTTPASMVKAPRVGVARKSRRNGSMDKIQFDKEVADKKQLANRFDRNNSSNKAQLLVEGITTPTSAVEAPRVGIARKSRRNSSSEKLQFDKEVANKKQFASRFDKNNSSNKAKMATRVSVGNDRGVKSALRSKLDRNNSSNRSKSDKRDETEHKPLNLHKDEPEKSVSLSTYVADENRRRSPSLQVRHY